MVKNDYNGWSSYSLEQGELKVEICPELGGRIMEFSLNGFNFLFVNPNLQGTKNIQPTPAWDKVWQNFGGDKIWPAPQGWSSREEWPGPPDPILDGGYYKSYITSPTSVRLASPHDPHTSLQILREIDLASDGVTIKVTFRNIGQTPVKWSIWPVIQINNSDEEENRYQIIIPKKENSIYEQGYKIMHGLVNNPQFRLENKNIVVDYKYIVGKIGTDSDAGWVAFCDRSCGKVLVVEYDYQSDAEYPDHTTVQIWTQGRGTFYSRNSIRNLVNDRIKNPGYSEIELLSPLQSIESESEINFVYKMRACTIPMEISVVNASKYAVTAKELTICVNDESVLISACYGFFQKGFVRLVLECDDERKALTTNMEVTSIAGFNLNLDLSLAQLENAQAILIEYIDLKGNSFIIDRKTVCKN